ncbi:MAG TPA: biotin carboxylase N-terminal domain-containing protein [Nocardioidaceae bacterium]|nr:biotin carboxylase N-terminal domain-containing protein [Nocardioidaceae bacterium]
MADATRAAGVVDIRRVLVANRGEIALRIIRAVRDSGLTSVAVYADPDADAPFVHAADEAVALGGATSAETYLDIAKIIGAAAAGDADAVHPGYGFLAENADFARAVVDAGLVWVGPPADVIGALGDKVRARAIAAEAGAPLAPGTREPVADASEALAFVRQHGLPVAIKAAHGGGGRGLRVARTEGEVAELFDAAVREATAAFGRGECFVEAYVEGGRHVEVQVLADSHGTIQVVGTRDCSLQRRYQKVVEEAPAPFLTSEQRTTLERSAAAVCRAAGYVNAATVEFLLSPEGGLSFLEVNTRLQVEHSVTEETVDIDVVREQLRIAAGLPVTPAATATPSGARVDHEVVAAKRHAIEFRINAEDPGQGFVPSTGTITRFVAPSGPGVRLDSGVVVGSEVSGGFDSLLAKLVVTGRDRTEAIERARRALAEFDIEGVRTTLPFHRAVVVDPAFVGDGPDGFTVHTGWIEQSYTAGTPPPGESGDADGRVKVWIGSRWMDVTVPVLARATEGPMARIREEARERLEQAAPGGNGDISAPMQGTVTRVAVAEGEEVEDGQVLVVIEAMKMENPVRATARGRVEGLRVTVGATVAQGDLLGRVATTDPEPA